MAHICSYYCQGPIHAIKLMISLQVPYETLSIKEQVSVRESLFLDLQKSSKKPSWIPLAIERLIPVKELSPLEFYQQEAGWNLSLMSVDVTQRYLPYVALVRYGTKEVADAVS